VADHDDHKKEEIWQVCADLCFQSISNGSMAIAAVVVDERGSIVTRGRNQLYDSLDPSGGVSNNIVAHAEINAIAAVPADRRWDKSLVLYTTVEPCPMCMGAVSMSPIRNVVIGSHDRYAGATRWADKQPFMRRKHIRIEFCSGSWEVLFAGLHAYSLMQRSAVPLTHPFYVEFGKEYPGLLRAVEQMNSDPETIGAIDRRDREWVSRRLVR